ncbi:transporter substrate-binding domain-containing protein [Bacillus sp. FJAT-49731]|uniref:Transporter substrate-binding domain-containing protein n=2 Tax=Lederbergia citrea TaxID=2833581 RepID=A0A942UVH1_9BACI|nr:transporter substrate-binding domain-containing protein [Lederbergia citrea]MBS4205892.1 transporter substrate-binding domain-containing protein [Lederbergia citrea]MBS4224659.1 transporter substrate-binding domain-containing protein [Lederbergia citrea]
MSALLLVTACGSGSKNNENGSKGNEKQEKTAWEKIEEKGELVVATSGTLFPTSYHEQETNNLTGYDVEIVKEVAKRLNLEVKFVEMAFDGMLTSLNSGTVDAAANDIGVNEERKDKFSFTDSYKYSFGSAVVRKDDLSGIKTLEDLKGKKAAGESTTVYMKIAREYGAKEVTYDNATNEQYLRDVSIGRTDVILNDYYLQSLALTVFPELNITIHPDIRYRPSEAAMILKKGNEDVIEKINGVLAEMREDGTISELSKKFYGGADVSVKQDLDFE